MPEAKRHVAYKSTISELLSGPFVQQEGDWSPTMIRIRGREAARVNIVGVAVSVQNERQFTLEDGTANVTVRSFDGPVNEVAAGDVVLVVGRPREYAQERYLAPELIKVLDSPLWLQLRKMELASTAPPVAKEEREEQAAPAPATTDEPAITEHPSSQLARIIKELDGGQGADTEDVLRKANSPDAERQLRSLLERGEIFEVRPGKVKVLE